MGIIYVLPGHPNEYKMGLQTQCMDPLTLRLREKIGSFTINNKMEQGVLNGARGQRECVPEFKGR